MSKCDMFLAGFVEKKRPRLALLDPLGGVLGVRNDCFEVFLPEVPGMDRPFTILTNRPPRCVLRIQKWMGTRDSNSVRWFQGPRSRPWESPSALCRGTLHGGLYFVKIFFGRYSLVGLRGSFWSRLFVSVSWPSPLGWDDFLVLAVDELLFLGAQRHLLLVVEIPDGPASLIAFDLEISDIRLHRLLAWGFFPFESPTT